MQIKMQRKMIVVCRMTKQNYKLFNTRAFCCSERIFIVQESYIVLQDLTSFELYHQVVISQHLDLTLLYADWTCREIDSLTHSHL